MKRVFFIHVPKCGGTSIAKAIQRAYFLSRIFHKRRGIQPIYGTISKELAKLFNEPIETYRVKLSAYALSIPYNVAVMGHVRFDKSLYDRFSSRWNYVTVLRDPVDRWYSEFYYIHKAKDSRDTYVPPPTMDYLNSPHAKFIATNYVRFFSSELHFHHFSMKNSSAINEIDWSTPVNSSIENLKGFTLIGFLDDLTTFKKAFKKIFGKNLKIGHHNKNLGYSNYQERVGKDIHNKVLELCAEDIKIYEWAKKNSNPTP
ncbi:sulfotransferase family 2 domain-containing protein [Gracilibacillus dipsosauri]|uniref:sulfotransferase family 2 domain-containing protein n=1 Tax=Gracilibacillus dipsosauri TaxID=178340 RepID=UPI00240A61BC